MSETTPQQETTLPNDTDEPTRPEPGWERESDETEELPYDPSDEAWLDSEGLYDDVSEEEAEEGRQMGERIDTGDDRDAGG